MPRRSKEPLSLVHFIDPKKLNVATLRKAQQLVTEHQGDYLKKKTSHRPVQLDDQTYQLLRQMKSKYDVYIYDIIKESVLFMSTILRK